MAPSRTKRELTKRQREVLLETLETRFRKNLERHVGVEWAGVRAKLEAAPEKLWALNEMEETEGEPDVVCLGAGEVVFCDCAAESPKGRVSLCYDREGWNSRKEHRPSGTAVEMAEEMGVELLTEEQYRALQELGEFDRKTSSWLKTPDAVRKLGGAIFGDRRYGRVFVYHNGAQSYYAARGFRGCLKL